MRPRSTLLICINGCKDRLCCWVAAGRNRRSWCPSLVACKEDKRMCLRTCQSDSVLPSGYNFAQSRHKPHAAMITCLPNSDMWLDCAHNLEMFGLIVLTQFVIMSKNMEKRKKIFKSSLMSDCSLVGCDSAAVVYHAMQSYSFSACLTLSTLCDICQCEFRPPNSVASERPLWFQMTLNLSPLLGRWHTHVSSEWHSPGNLVSSCKNTLMMTQLLQTPVPFLSLFIKKKQEQRDKRHLYPWCIRDSQNGIPWSNSDKHAVLFAM